jgi:hypothetical protein
METGNLQQEQREPDGAEAARPTLSGVGAVAADRLRRRFRRGRFWVLVAVYAVALVALTGLSFAAAWAMATLSNGGDIGPLVYSAVVFAVLLLAIVAGPAAQGRALNAPALARTTADRPSTARGPQTGPAGAVLGALVAEWVTSLVFVAVALPVLLVVAVAGGVPAHVVAGSLAIVVLEILLLGAIAVGLSGLIERPGRSVAVAYGVMAVLTVGTLLVFAAVGNLVQHEVVTESRGVSWSSTELIADCGQARADGASDCVEDDDGEGVTTCEAWQTTTSVRPRLDLAWWALAPNPAVIVADATPLTWQGSMQSPVDLFGIVTAGVRQAQTAGEQTETLDACTIDDQDAASTVPALVDRTAPSWYLGLLVQVALAVGVLLGAVRVIRDRRRRS